MPCAPSKRTSAYAFRTDAQRPHRTDRHRTALGPWRRSRPGRPRRTAEVSQLRGHPESPLTHRTVRPPH
eukprot:6217586-Pyramimonas_sp.AAC.1